MAKKAILDVLESTIGKYVQNLDSQSLNVAVWNGQIELHNLALNIGAVNAELDRQAAEAPNLALPFRVRSGHFESLQIDVPWARITSRSVVFRAQGLHIQLEPCHRKSVNPLVTSSPYDEEKRVEKLNEDRVHSIKLYDDYRKQANAIKKLAQVDDDGQASKDSSTTSSFGSRLVRRIVENLQVEIEQVHISFRNHACSAGVVLEKLSLVTTDQHGSRTFVDRTAARTNNDKAKDDKESSFLYKVLQISGLGFYLNEDSSSSNPYGSISEEGSGSISTKNAHSYILEPLSFEARLRQSDNVQCIDFPKYLLSSELSKLSIVLLRSQLEHMHRIATSLAANTKNGAQPIFPEYRPLSRISSTTAKAWWQYAFRCVRRLKGKGRMWVEFHTAFQKRKQYISLYKRHVHAEAWMTPLTAEERILISTLEADRSISVDGLMTWRSIGDAQADLERSKQGDILEKKNKNKRSSYLSSFFTSSAAAAGDSDDNDEDDPPITLTVEEMKELEAVSLDQSDELELSNDSWLCDLSFELGAFQIDLLNSHRRPLTALKMGRVNTSFNANADGSFHCDLKLSSLIIQDLVTQNTLFPMILRNLASSEDQQQHQALELRFEKSKTGDQEVRLSMVAFEMVASPLLIMETKKFFSLGEDAPSARNPQNPMLRESLSGSVDLFFDADSGQASMPVVDHNDLLNDDAGAPTFQDQLSLALAEAWKSKTKEKTAWTVDCDIQAPVLIIPESCSHYEAVVLVFDLGHVDFSYGNGNRATPEVVEWGKSQSTAALGFETSLDAGNVSIAKLGFSIGKAKDILTASGVSVKDHIGKTKPIIEPVSATLNCGILTVENEASARLCAVGSFPSLSLRASPKQVTDALTVVNVWAKMAAKLGYEGQHSSQGEGLLIVDDDGAESRPPAQVSSTEDNLSESDPVALDKKGIKLFLAITVHRLSIYLTRNEGDGVETHLVSASASLSQMMDGSSASKVAMGWFWILDMLHSDTPRRQRLLAHSTLPRSADDIAEDGKYEIFDDIEAYIFSGDYDGSSGLADITWWSPGETSTTLDYDPFVSANPFDEEDHNGSILQANFAALYVHWNPRAIKVFASALTEIAGSAPSRAGNDLLLSPRSPEKRMLNFSRDSGIMSPTTEGSVGTSGRLLVKANMAKFEVLLNSAKDDLPLYKFTMSDTSVEMISVQSNSRLNLKVGDLRVTTPLSSVSESYRNILGLAPTSLSSLLSVKYFDGERAVMSRVDSEIDRAGSEKIESYADIVISPMRLVYLQAQVLTLVDYVNDGILGALAAQAATSAAAVALELATSGKKGDKIFALKAVGFDLVIPESAKSERFFVVQAGNLVTSYKAYPNPGGGLAQISLGEVMLRDEGSISLVEHPLHATVTAEINPEGIGSLDDQAMRVNVQISTASFLVSKAHYAQMMFTLDGNVGQEDSYLRGAVDQATLQISRPSTELAHSKSDDISISVNLSPTMTHAGVAAVEKKTRMYVSLTLNSVSLETFRTTRSDALARIEAVKILVGMDLIPDQELTTMRVSLHNLTCQDKRTESAGRQFTNLFDRSSIEAVEKDVFAVTYTKDARALRSDIDMTIGAPRVVMIPDTIADLVDFVSVTDSASAQEERVPTKADTTGDKHVEVLEESGAIETTFSLDTRTFSFALNASSCQIVLVDLGSSGNNSSGRAATESIVLQGHFVCTYLQESEIETGIERRTDLEVHGNDIEAYTAYGIDLIQPLSILEPTSFTAFYNLRNIEGRTAEIEIRAVTLLDVDMTLSMQNVALLDVIASGLTESLEKPHSLTEQALSQNPLSDEETKRISDLASALDSVDSGSRHDQSFSVHEGSSIADDASSSSNKSTPEISPFHWKVRATLPKVVVTIVNDLQGLDEPLLRIGTSNMVFGGEATRGMHLSKLESLFDAHMNCTLAADYFDPAINLWQELLSRPWEVTLKGTRGVSKRYRTNRLSTTFDLESFPCHISFSEQFLASLNGANGMWSTYSNAINSATDHIQHASALKKKALAASAARKLITSLPYGVENVSGLDLHFSVHEEDSAASRRLCSSGVIQYFRFEPPRGDGYGGRRLYGQEVSRQKALKLYIENRTIVFDHIDNELGQSRKVHKFDDGLIVITHLHKEAKSMILHVGTQVGLVNRSSIPFQVSVTCRDSLRVLGKCEGSSNRQQPLSFVGDAISQDSMAFELPADMLRSFEDGAVKPVITLSPQIPNGDLKNKLVGEIIVPSYHEILALVESGSTELVVDTNCSASGGDNSSDALPDPFVVLVRIKLKTVGTGHPFVEISLEPRATLTNAMPIPLDVKTVMPHTFTRSPPTESASREQLTYETIHSIPPTESMEVFTPGPSFAVCVRCSELPIGGGTTSWMKGSWVDLPMVREFRLPEPIQCQLPFVDNDGEIDTSTGVTFFVVESRDDLSEATFEENDKTEASLGGSYSTLPRSHSLELNESEGHKRFDAMRSYLLTVCNYAFDHTRSILFEQVTYAPSMSSSNPRNSNLRQSLTDSILGQSLTPVTPSPFSAFASMNRELRVSLLPSSRSLLRILQLTIEGESGVKQSQPFRIDDISICDGGIESSPVRWEDGSKTGFFMYRTLVGLYQSEVHVVPEFIVYNASKSQRVIVRQIGAEVLIEPGKMSPVRPHPKMGLVFTLDYLDFAGRAGPLKVDDLKHQIAMVKSIEGYPIGSLAVQTVIGGRHSRLVVKLGEVRFGESSNSLLSGVKKTMWERDLVRMRIRWSELNLTLCETRPVHIDQGTGSAKVLLVAVADRIKHPGTPKNATGELNDKREKMKDPVCTICLNQFTVDWQRIFKEEPQEKRFLNRHQLLSPERSQLSLIIHNFQVLDRTPISPYPVVFDSTSSKISFLDLCVRTRGSLDADLVKVDMLDLNLAHMNGVSDKIVIKTSEDFVWKILDISDRIMEETTKISGIDIALQWDKADGDYRVVIREDNFHGVNHLVEYSAPPSNRLIDLNKARVSPFSLVVSFRRQPQASRYKLVRDINGAKLVNYFTTRLKFTLDKAELKFARYEGKNIKGPPSRLVEILTAVYVSRMKLKVVSILSAANFQDWKYLAARDGGDDEFVEGDVLRITGNLAGKGASFLAKTVGEGIGGGLSSVTKSFGDGIENASEKVGARAVGAGVNSVVTGLGDGVGSTVKGVGKGAGKILKGAGVGVGQIFGGVTGAVLIAGKGIGKGVSKGDGRAVLNGFSEGASSVGTGVGQGVETAVIGAADGVLAVGQGFFSGVKSVGKGFGGVFNPKKSPKK